MHKITIGRKIKIARISRDMIQEDLALLANIDRVYLARIETGKANPSIKILSKIATALKKKLIVEFK